MKLVFGLGNPGKPYENTRHNYGWMVLNSIAEKKGLSFSNDKSGKNRITNMKIGEEKVILAKPQTFMNNSGQAVAELQHFYKISTKDVIVIYDDIDIPFGKIRISVNKSSGGHNGIKSIIKETKEKDFVRLRMGIGAEHKSNSEDFVLKKFSSSEKRKLNELIDSAHLALETIVEKGVSVAANKYN